LNFKANDQEAIVTRFPVGGEGSGEKPSLTNESQVIEQAQNYNFEELIEKALQEAGS